jgi:hypothetical protein
MDYLVKSNYTVAQIVKKIRGVTYLVAQTIRFDLTPERA